LRIRCLGDIWAKEKQAKRRVEETTQLGALPLTKYYSGDQIEKNMMGGECRTFVGEEWCRQGFGGET
jgi:hypothetical protein